MLEQSWQAPVKQNREAFRVFAYLHLKAPVQTADGFCYCYYLITPGMLKWRGEHSWKVLTKQKSFRLPACLPNAGADSGHI